MANNGTPQPDTAGDSQGYFKTRLALSGFSKYAVALKAVTMLSEGDSLLIDAGTSLLPLAKIIQKRTEIDAEHTHYTIMTHNYAAFSALTQADPRGQLNVFHTGGRYDSDLNALFGHQAEVAYQGFNPTWVFIGETGVEADCGLFCHGNTEELALKKALFALPTDNRVIVSDFMKIGKRAGLVFGLPQNLTTGASRCILLTDDPHDGQFERVGVGLPSDALCEAWKECEKGALISAHSAPDKNICRECPACVHPCTSTSSCDKAIHDVRARFDVQTSTLKDRYTVRVDVAHFVVIALGQGEIVHKEPSSTHDYLGNWRLKKPLPERTYRLILTEEDKTRITGPGCQAVNSSSPYVDLYLPKEGDFSIKALSVG